MGRVVFRSYQTGEVLQKKKLNKKAEGVSVTYRFEGNEFVIRSYRTGDVLQKFVPKFGGSCIFKIEE